MFGFMLESVGEDERRQKRAAVWCSVCRTGLTVGRPQAAGTSPDGATLQVHCGSRPDHCCPCVQVNHSWWCRQNKPCGGDMETLNPAERWEYDGIIR